MFTALEPGLAKLLHDYVVSAVAEVGELQTRLLAASHQARQQHGGQAAPGGLWHRGLVPAAPATGGPPPGA